MKHKTEHYENSSNACKDGLPHGLARAHEWSGRGGRFYINTAEYAGLFLRLDQSTTIIFLLAAEKMRSEDFALGDLGDWLVFAEPGRTLLGDEILWKSDFTLSVIMHLAGRPWRWPFFGDTPTGRGSDATRLTRAILRPPSTGSRWKKRSGAGLKSLHLRLVQGTSGRTYKSC